MRFKDAIEDIANHYGKDPKLLEATVDEVIMVFYDRAVGEIDGYQFIGRLLDIPMKGHDLENVVIAITMLQMLE